MVLPYADKTNIKPHISLTTSLFKLYQNIKIFDQLGLSIMDYLIQGQTNLSSKIYIDEFRIFKIFLWITSEQNFVKGDILIVMYCNMM